MSSHLSPVQTLRVFHLVSHLLISSTLIIFLCTGCGGYFQAHSDENDTAMTIELTPDELEALFRRISESLQESGMMRLWNAYARQGKPIKLGVLTIENQVKSNLGNTLTTQLTALENDLREAGLKVVSRSAQPHLLNGLRDPIEQTIIKKKVEVLGQQLEVQYLLTGKLYSVTDDHDQGQTIQYFLFMQVIEVKNGAVRWQMEVETLKGH